MKDELWANDLPPEVIKALELIWKGLDETTIDFSKVRTIELSPHTKESSDDPLQ